MMGLSALLLLLAAPQGSKASEPDLDRARRAAIVDRIMAEPPKPRLARPAPVRQAEPQPDPFEDRRSLVLEPKGPGLAGDEAAADARIPPGFRPIGAREMVLSSVNFDRWLFDDTSDEMITRARLASLLDQKLLSARGGRRIGPDQLRKLRLAGGGDIKRLFDRAGEKRREFEAIRHDYNAGRMVLTQLEPLARDFRIGPFDGESLFAKTLRKIDEEGRAARFGPK